MLYWILRQTRSEQWEKRSEAAAKLGESGDPRAVEPLIDLLQDRNISVLREAVLALGKIGHASAVEPLLELVDHKYRSVRRSVAMALGGIGDVRAVEPLLDMLKDRNVPVRVAAAQALGEIGDTRAVVPLESILDDNGAGDEARKAVEIALVGIRSGINTTSVIETYSIKATAGDHGSISPAGEVKVDHGESVRLTITPEQCYRVLDVLVDGKSVGAVTEYMFENVDSDHTVEAIFKARIYRILASAGTGGRISPSDEVTVNCRTSHTFAITPDRKHRVLDVLVDGSSVGAVREYTFRDVTEFHNISASFTPKETTNREEKLRRQILPLILSFICCGLGQVYRGEVKKGISFLLIYSLLILSFFTSLSSHVFVRFFVFIR